MSTSMPIMNQHVAGHVAPSNPSLFQLPVTEKIPSQIDQSGTSSVNTFSTPITQFGANKDFALTSESLYQPKSTILTAPKGTEWQPSSAVQTAPEMPLTQQITETLSDAKDFTVEKLDNARIAAQPMAHKIGESLIVVKGFAAEKLGDARVAAEPMTHKIGESLVVAKDFVAEKFDDASAAVSGYMHPHSAQLNASRNLNMNLHRMPAPAGLITDYKAVDFGAAAPRSRKPVAFSERITTRLGEGLVDAKNYFASKMSNLVGSTHNAHWRSHHLAEQRAATRTHFISRRMSGKDASELPLSQQIGDSMVHAKDFVVEKMSGARSSVSEFLAGDESHASAAAGSSHDAHWRAHHPATGGAGLHMKHRTFGKRTSVPLAAEKPMTQQIGDKLAEAKDFVAEKLEGARSTVSDFLAGGDDHAAAAADWSLDSAAFKTHEKLARD